ncbi:polar amino acid transport system permease protein [Rhodoligotrophos appendicifer]|uniref:amino acid ABC transporter permease n=1 Tax=Rhodoligotrophos appendicifer TaxID=987056 RepID=UPI0011848AFC|nr:amino acid ABC transporter permease [Rhodoligotrophos appendicifer]
MAVKPSPTRKPLFRRNRIFTDYVPALIALVIIFWVATAIRWDFVATLQFEFLWQFRWALLQGLGITLLLTGVAMTAGLPAGFLLAAMMQSPWPPIRWLAFVYVESLRNTPLVLQLFWIHYALPSFTGYSTTVLQSGMIAMTMQSSAYLADVARTGIQAIGHGQWEAAKALGLPRRVVWMKVVLPQALKIIIPPLANIAIGYFKASAVLALLAVGDLMTVGVRIANFTFKPIETLTVVGIIYLVLGYIFSSLTYRLEALYGKSEVGR